MLFSFKEIHLFTPERAHLCRLRWRYPWRMRGKETSTRISVCLISGALTDMHGSIEDINKSCLEEFRAHYECLDNNNQQLWQCRPAEWRLNKCVFHNLVRCPRHPRFLTIDSAAGPLSSLAFSYLLTSCSTIEIGEDHPRRCWQDPRAPASTTDIRTCTDPIPATCQV